MIYCPASISFKCYTDVTATKDNHAFLVIANGLKMCMGTEEG